MPVTTAVSPSGARRAEIVEVKGPILVARLFRIPLKRALEGGLDRASQGAA